MHTFRLISLVSEINTIRNFKYLLSLTSALRERGAVAAWKGIWSQREQRQGLPKEAGVAAQNSVRRFRKFGGFCLRTFGQISKVSKIKTKNRKKVHSPLKCKNLK